jgi:hypothetical protein
MEGVQFDEPQGYRTHYPEASKKVSKMAGWLIDKHYAKTPGQANAFFAGFAIVLIIIAFLIPRLFSSDVKEKVLRPGEDKTLQIQ